VPPLAVALPAAPSLALCEPASQPAQADANPSTAAIDAPRRNPASERTENRVDSRKTRSFIVKFAFSACWLAMPRRLGFVNRSGIGSRYSRLLCCYNRVVNPPTMIYRLVAAEVWQRALQAGSFAGTEHDLRDGFIHFSSATQVAETAARHYAGQSGLLLLRVDVAVLGTALRWEPSRGGDLFPHLYATLPVGAVNRVEPLPLGADGRHVLPALD
jgi:uncharacterized protein (DUF952 family)